MRARWRCASSGLLALLSSSCQEAEPRPQVVVSIDVDMAVTSQLAEGLSPAAVVDTVRVELFDGDGLTIAAQQFAITSTADLPLSFGVPSDIVAGGHVLMRVRAFRAAFAAPGELALAGVAEPVPVLDPIANVTVDRLVSVTLPDVATAIVSVTLSGECIGVPVRFGIGDQPDQTCVDGERTSSPTNVGIDSVPKLVTAAGSWWRAASVPCSVEAPPGSVCIPGGLSILGDPLFVARSEIEYDAVPLRVVWLAPFHLDRTEQTVGQLHALIDEHGYRGPLPDPPDASDPLDKYCTFDAAAESAQPLNCLDYTVADAVCAAWGGAVVSEAQWDYAARGRGERRLYSWGDTTPGCCNPSFGRIAGGGCDGRGPERVGTDGDDPACASDVSKDGVLDLVGNVAELVRDSIASYGDPCWSAGGIIENPVCEAATGRIARGGSWAMPAGDLPLPLRRAFSESDPGYGFRCAYAGEP